MGNSKKNTDTFTITKSGVYHLYGFLQDSAGNKGKCKIDLEVSLVVPSCELAVTNGTLGDNSWYKSDVEVGFTAKESNSSAQIVKYYIEEEKTDLDTTEAVKSEAPEKSMDTYVVKANQKTNQT